jgi:hypothetical protein
MPESCLKDEIIIVRLVEENHSMHIPKGKNGHLKFEGSFTNYDVPLTKHGTLADVLTKNEREFLEGFLDSSRPKGWMSVYVQDAQNVWKGRNRYKVELGLEGIDLDMNNPMDFIKHAILKANTNDIAPSYDKRNDRQYIYYMENKKKEDEGKVALIDVKIKASNLFAEISKSKAKTINVLMVVFRGDINKVPNEMTENTAKATLFNYVDTNPVAFIDAVEDIDYSAKAMLYKAMRRGVINRSGFDYNLGMGDGRLIGKGMLETLDYIKSLSTDNNKQDEFIKFKAALKE